MEINRCVDISPVVTSCTVAVYCDVAATYTTRIYTIMVRSSVHNSESLLFQSGGTGFMGPKVTNIITN